MTVDVAAGYRVRESRLRTGLNLALGSWLPVVAMVIGVLSWSGYYAFFLSGLLFEIILIAVMFTRLRRAIRHEPLFAIGPDGVFLGPDDRHRPPQLEPWSRVDCVVHFKGRSPATDGHTERHVGVVKDDKIVTFRTVQGWRFNTTQAEAAIALFGQGAVLREAPFQPDVPRDGVSVIPLPREWQSANN
ncbi:hypothetical protein [Actinoplanes sp. NPDC051851]|uniref:hypothetical protein n=1 Tax=Actinoplanes sp. NPDC051851 TaxID=3154753 RepID=UPI00342576AB